MLRKLLSLCLMACCLTPVEALSTSAQSVILMELESGRILYEENSQEEKLIASITKLLTALVAMESEIPLDTLVEIPPEALAVEGSSLYLQEEEQMSLEGLLYGLLLHSGNDAAVAIAITCGGSVEEFVQLMNEKSEELGMSQSHFANPHGLNDDNHYSTALDMAILAQACLGNPELATMVATQNIAIDGRQFTNKNKLLWNYEGCIGMKTGYTQLAGRTLVSAATRDGMTLICVTLHDSNDWLDHCNLFDYGFQNYTMTELPHSTEHYGSLPVSEGLLPFVPITLGETVRYPLTQGEELSQKLCYPLETPVLAPVTEGQPCGGELQWFLGEELIASSPLVYAMSLENIRTAEETLWSKMRQFLGTLWLSS